MRKLHRVFCIVFLWCLSTSAYSQENALCGEYEWGYDNMTQKIYLLDDFTFYEPIIDDKTGEWFDHRGRYQIKGDEIAMVYWTTVPLTKYGTISADRQSLSFNDRDLYFDENYKQISKKCAPKMGANNFPNTDNLPLSSYKIAVNHWDINACTEGNEADCIGQANIKDDLNTLNAYCAKNVPLACENLYSIIQRDEYKKASENNANSAWRYAYGEFRFSPQALEKIGGMCQASMPSKLCEYYAKGLWRARRFEEAFKQGQANCQARIDGLQCAHVQASLPFFNEIIKNTDSEKIPCGNFKANALNGDITFSSKGMFTFEFGDPGSNGAAKIEDGEIHIKTMNQDNVYYLALNDKTLIGLNEWDAFALYHRTNEKVVGCNR